MQHINSLRVWCQKVLPLVYDESLSYYESICKISKKLNDVIKNVNEIPSYIDATIEERLSDEHIKEILSIFMRALENAISTNNEGDNTNSAHDYSVDEMLWWKDELYIAIRSIDAGDTLIPNTNIRLVDFEDIFNDFLSEVKKDFTSNDEGGSTTASKDYTAGDWLWINNVLYIATKNITEGNAFIYTGVNTNVSKITMDMVFDTMENTLTDAINAEATARTNADNSLSQRITDEVTARTNAITGLTNNLNTEITERQSADTTLSQRITDEATARANDDALLWGNLISLNRHVGAGSIVVIGDSYIADYNPNFATFLADYMGKTINTNFFISSLGGSGFSAANLGKNFYALLEDAYAAISTPIEVSLVIFAGGYNDIDKATLENDTISTINRAKVLFPSAAIAVYNVSGGVQDLQGKCIVDRAYCSACAQSGASYNYVGGILKCMAGAMRNDLIHPTEYGEKLLAGSILTTLIGGKQSCHNDYITPITDCTYPIYAVADTDRTLVALQPNSGVLLGITLASNVTYDGYHPVVSYNVGNSDYPTLLKGNKNEFFTCTGSCLYQANTEDWVQCAINIMIDDGKIYFMPLIADANGWKTGTAGDNINIGSLCFRMEVSTLEA